MHEPPAIPLIEALGRTAHAFAAHARASRGVPRDEGVALHKALTRRGTLTHPRLSFAPLSIARQLSEESPEGTVVKFLTTVPARPPDAPGSPAPRGLAQLRTLDVEAVLIPMIGKTGRRTHTLCVSSQVGCAMGCTFCETGQMGLVRSLSAGEIVAQWWLAAHALGVRPANVVFMGMGEPMDNLDEVLDAIAVLIDHHGPAVPVSKVTISTVGRVDGIARLAEKLCEPGWRRLNLALSLNAPNDRVRSAIMPINRRWDMAALQRALMDFPVFGGGKLCIEYVLIPGVNDAPEHAAEVAEFLRPINERYQAEHDIRTPRCLLNLIPYNPRRDSPWPAPDEQRVDQFLAWLLDRGVYAKRRRTKGRAMMGACGQLGSAGIRGRRLVET